MSTAVLNQPSSPLSAFTADTRAAWTSLVASLAVMLFLFRGRIADLALQNQSIEYFVLAAALLLLLLRLRGKPLTRRNGELVTGALLLSASIGSLVLLDALKRPIISSTPLLVALTAFSVIWTLYGMAEAGKQLFPAAYFLLMTPLPVAVVVVIDLPLQILSAGLACHAARLLGIQADRIGTTVRLRNSEITFRIIADCNGLRSAVAMFAIALLLGWLWQTSYPKRLLLVLAGLALAYVGNILRLTTILALMDRFGEKFIPLLPRFEAWYGAAIFAAAIGILFLMARGMGCRGFRAI